MCVCVGGAHPSGVTYPGVNNKAGVGVNKGVNTKANGV